MTLLDLSFVVFRDPHQGSNGICLLLKYVVFVVWGIVILPSLSPYSNKVLISGAHRWETDNTYLQDICCIVKPWIEKNKSKSQIKMCMCGEWMVYGDNGNNSENNGESLILLFALLKGYIPFLHFEAFWGEWDALNFVFSFLSGGYLVPLILLSDTCPFLNLVSLFLFFEVPGTCPFLFPRIFFTFFFLYIEHSSP